MPRPTPAPLTAPSGWVLAALLTLPGAAALTAHADPTTPPAPPTQGAPSPVDVRPLRDMWLHPQRSASAQVVARNEARVAAEVAGVVQRWEADVGTSVRAGQVLARLDPADHELAVQRARAARDAAQARLELLQAQARRAHELHGQGFISADALQMRDTELALQRAELASAQAALASAERALAKTVVRAPFAGTVTQRLAQQGETVAAGTPLFVLVQTGAAELQAQLSPAEVRELGRVRDVRFEADDGATRAARLLRAVPALAGGTRLQTVRLALQGEPLPPGAAGVLRWQAPLPHVPAELLVRRGSALGVFVVEGEGEQARARFVALPEAQEGRPAAAASLAGDACVVVRGQHALHDGQRVTPSAR